VKQSPIRWGVLATGRIAHQFVQDFAFVDGGVVAAVASRNLDSALAFAHQHGIARGYGDYQELFHDPQLDVIYIATPHSMHLQNGLDALRAGKAVLCEKPLTVNPAEALVLADAAAMTGGYLMEAMWTWFLPALRTALAWVEQGRIGAIRHIKADFGYPQLPFDAQRREYDAQLAGGCLLEMGIYPVALAWLFMRRDPTDIQVRAQFAPNGVEDDLSMLFSYPDCTATLATSFRCKLQNWAYIIGERGYIAIPDFWRASECRLFELDRQIDHFEDGRTSLGFNYEVDAVNADLRAGRSQSAVVSLTDSLAFQRHMAEVKRRFQA